MRPVTFVLATALVVLAACTSPNHRAPVEERGVRARPAPATATGPSGAKSAAAETPAAGAVVDEAAARAAPGTYVVKPGDTLIRIGLDHGQNWRDIARWSGLDNPNSLDVGQVLRVVPPDVDPVAAVPQSASPSARVDAKTGTAAGPVDSAPVVAATAAAASTAKGGPSPAATPVAPPAANTNNAAKEADDALTWQWPAAGPVLRGFDEAQSKGVVIGGRAGDPVLAAADGRVAYAGSGLRGYGNLIIVKHNGTFLSAYAHNQALLVKEDQVVRRGQKIAEMGATDAQRVQLHFEIRRLGRPVDPTRLLPAR